MSFNFCRSYAQICFLIFVLRSTYVVTRVMFLTVSRATCTVSSAISLEKVTGELRGSTKRNITTIEVALTGRSCKKFSFLDAQSVKLAFCATYRNYSPNFVRENQICVGVQMDHTEQHSSTESSAIEKNFWSLIGLGWLFFELSFVVTNDWNELSSITANDLKWRENIPTHFHLFYKSSNYWSSKLNNRFFHWSSSVVFFYKC